MKARIAMKIVIQALVFMIISLAGTSNPAFAESSACKLPDKVALLFWLDTPEVKPGGHLKIQALWTDEPGHFEAVPLHCLNDVTIMPKSLATLSSDTSYITISDTANDADYIVISAKIDGKDISGRARVTIPSLHPLAGIWHEVQVANCPLLPEGQTKDSIQELIFRADGTFSVTWQPFESYHDYAGTYTYRTQTRDLVLDVTGGNYVPSDLVLTGKGQLTDTGTLRVTGINFGTSKSGSRHNTDCGTEFIK